MHTVDRGGVHIDQCSQCRGIFLDRGELEQMLSAEQRHYGGIPPYEGGGHYRPDSPGPYRHGQYPDSPGPYGRRRKRSFLEGLFD